MVIHYNFSKRGKSHFAENKPCQDSNCVIVTDSGLTIAGVADGVGSAANSEFGSRIASDTAVGHLSSVLSGISPERVVISELKRAFELAFAEVCKHANNDGNPLSSYDTTLSVAVYDGDTCVYGHSGDGAIIGLTDEGDYIEITTPQKGEDAVSVMPLRAGASYWKFGVYEKPLTSVILVTDGMRDLMCPSLLSRAESNVYVPATAFFADPYLWSKKRQRKTLEATVEGFTEADGSFGTDEFLDRLEEIYNHRIPDLKGEELQDFKRKCIAPDLMSRIDDDKTVVGLINTSKEPGSKEIYYYMEPDWMDYKRARDKVIYGAGPEETPPTLTKGKGEGDAGNEPEKPGKDKPDSREVGEEVKIPDEVIVEKTTDKKGRNKFIIPLIAAGAAAAAIAIGVGVATSKPPIVDDHTNASGSTEESTEGASYGDNDNVNDDTENKATESITVSTTTQTGTQFTGEQKPETTTEKEDRITEESQETESIETETNNTNSSSNSNDEIDRDTTDINEFLKKKANDNKTDIYYVRYDYDGEKEIIWEKKDGNELLKSNISTGKSKNLNSTLKDFFKKIYFDNHKKIFHYTEDTIQ